MADINKLRVDRSVMIEHSLQEAASTDKAYWVSRSPEERLEAIELMRQINYGYNPATTRLQRVLTIVERKAS